MRYFIELSYFGKPYHGWQRQPNAVTVQQTIEEALSTLLRTSITIIGAGRTDTGVHAAQMYAHFDSEIVFPIAYNQKEVIALDKLTHKLNSFLPPAIAVHRIFEVQPNAHARFDAIQRSYIYRIAKSKNVFSTEAAFQCKYRLDFSAMNTAAAILLEYKDFECFSKSNTDVNTYLCDIKEAYWMDTDDEWQFKITANRFLRNMVRAIVGTLVEIGQGKQKPEWMHHVIASKNRSVAGTSVPAHGLYLTEVLYPEIIYKK